MKDATVNIQDNDNKEMGKLETKLDIRQQNYFFKLLVIYRDSIIGNTNCFLETLMHSQCRLLNEK